MPIYQDNKMFQQANVFSVKSHKLYRDNHFYILDI